MTTTFKKVKTLEDIQNDPRVDSIGKESDDGESYWLYLKAGWQWDRNQQHTIHERTLKQICNELNNNVTEWLDDPALTA